MNCIVRRLLPVILLWTAVLTISVPTKAQDITVPAAVSARPAISVLDSTKEQDGLLGSVRRVKTEVARIELKEGRSIEGPPQLVEITTYGIKGNRIENTSYPTGGGVAGKEEYKYDEHGNITEMTVRDDHGSIISREAYNYEFDKFGNWTKMLTSLVVFENGELKREPIEVSYRTVTYYFDDTVAKIVAEPKVASAPSIPGTSSEIRDQEVLEPAEPSTPSSSTELAGDPPPLIKAEIKAEVKTDPATSEPPTSAPTTSDPPKSEPLKSVPSGYQLYLSGRDRFDAGDAPGAIAFYQQSLKVAPSSAEVQLALGHAYLMLQKDRDAIKAFKESIKLNPDAAETHYGLGYSYFRIGRFREAADAFKKATTLDPRMAKAHYGLSLSYQELGFSSGLMEEYRILETLDKSLAKKLVMTFPQFNFSCRLIRGCP